jgi:hypothetical protein
VGCLSTEEVACPSKSRKLVFRGWKDVPEPWTLANCCEYIEWYHIGKVFPEDRHNKHRRFSKAKLKYCLDAEFKQRCIEVYQVLYNHEFVHRNEASLTICRMVWAKLKLGKMVDWKTLKAAPGIHIPTERDIPRGVLKFPGGGLSIRRNQVEKPEDYKTSDFDPDSDSDGSQPLKLSNNLAAVASRRLRMRKRGRDDGKLPFLHPPHLNVVPHIPGASNTAGTINTAGTSSSDAAGAGGMLLALALQCARNMAGADNNPGTSESAGADNNPFLTAYPGNPRDNLRMLEIRANMDAFATPPLPERALCGSNTVALWRRRSK